MTTKTPSKSRIAETWRQIPASTLHGAERHSKFVYFMRLTLPILAVGLIAIVLIYSVAYKPNIQRVLDYPINGAGLGAVSMEEPHLTGMDALGRYVVVSAKSAERLPEDPETVTLKVVSAKITKNDETLLDLRASTGQIFSAIDTLEFGPPVAIDLPGGYAFVTERVEAQLKNGIIQGPEPIRGTGPLGKISANSFKINRKTDVFQLQGDVHITVDMTYMSELNQANTPAPEKEE
ncbi:MAG: LPS export ABC transporter periplasmic protein LptC [Alphaproteobacteria bacterium]|nr:MAG: LPS export ABC transporter periplasmic protein LptC [Alphaproteobacteria bacterium]